MNSSLNPRQAGFYIKLILNTIFKTHVSFDKAFKQVSIRYKIPRGRVKDLYRLAYYTVNYYYTLKWLSARFGYGGSIAGIVDFFSSIGFSIRRLIELVEEEATELTNVRMLSIKYSYPEYLIRDLMQHVDVEFVEKMLSSLNERKRWLRLNTLRTSIENIYDCLESEGIEYEKTDLTMNALLVNKPLWEPISVSKCVKQGYVVPQDISSVLSIEIIDENPEIILDACSAPGLKLSYLYMLYDNKLCSIAVDASSKRLHTMKLILKRLNVDTSKVLLLNGDSAVMNYSRVFKLAIVDAPCSGLGAVYSDPAVKLNSMRRSKLDYYHEKQLIILKNTLRFAERVLFITCSIHSLEGESVVDKIVENDLAEPIEINKPYLHRAYNGFHVSKNTYRIYPHVVNGQGFYIALLESRVVGR